MMDAKDREELNRQLQVMQEHNTNSKLGKALKERGIESIEDLDHLLEPSFTATIPLTILEDKNLSDSSKLLYAEITALTKKSGYCYATNQYLGDRIGKSKQSITDNLKHLIDNNLIKVEIDKSKKGTFRKIFILWRGSQNQVEGYRKTTTPDTEGSVPKLDINKEKLKIDNIYAVYKEKIQEGARLTDEAKAKIKTRLKVYSESDLIDCINKFSSSKWWMDNNSGRGIAWFFKSDDRIEQFKAIKPDQQQQVINIS